MKSITQQEHVERDQAVDPQQSPAGVDSSVSVAGDRKKIAPSAPHLTSVYHHG